jgi:hypothetical protein
MYDRSVQRKSLDRERFVDLSLVIEFERRPLPPFLSALGAPGAVGSAGKQKAADKMPAACLIAINYVNSISHRFE